MKNKPVDIVMWAGEQFYTVTSFIEEAKHLGVSKRIPSHNIPYGIVPGESRIFIKHRKAIVTGKVNELIEYLVKETGIAPIDPETEMLVLTMLLEKYKEKDLTFWQELVDNFDISWKAGVIGYSYITGIQYVAKDNEDDLPDEYSHLKGYVEPVRVTYENS